MIRILIAEDQAMVLGALAALLGYWLPYFPPAFRFHFNGFDDGFWLGGTTDQCQKKYGRNQ